MPTSAFVAFMLLIALLLGACATAGSPPRGVPTTGTGEGTKGLPSDVAGAPAPGIGGVSGTGGTDYSSVDLAARRIVKTGAISIEVPNVASAMSLVRAMALQLGGYVGNSQVGTFDQSATLTLRIPAAKFDDAIARLHKLDGTVQTETTQEQDVTSAIVDLAARLTNLQASEAQYRLLLEKAVKVEDILAVQSHLDDVRGQIEQLQAQQKELTGLADLATLTVSLVPGAVQQATSKWAPGKTMDFYIRAAGGPSRKADVKRAYVTQPNGKVEARESRFLLPDGIPKPYAGSTVFVPERDPLDRPTDLLATVGVIAQIMAGLATLLVAARR